MGLVALQHVGSSQTRDQTRVPCIGRWILNHCATREVLNVYIFKQGLKFLFFNSVSMDFLYKMKVLIPLPVPPLFLSLFFFVSNM